MRKVAFFMAFQTDNSAVKRLLFFFDAMNAWGSRIQMQDEAIDWAKITEEEYRRLNDSCREELKLIFADFCESGVNATRLKDDGLSYHKGAQFYEEVTLVKDAGDAVIIETQETAVARWRYRYEMVFENGTWKIRDNRKRSSDRDRRWKKDML